ncbi:MAG TPA: VOC family protein [Acidobacteriaceae bacterium]|jgi:uncharacterized glyoxalase superfamily protein PhnB|nr:VOC family protein [Acidobacteriaceae bacterium]
MTSNRSLPTSTVLPHLCYRDVEEAIVWLTRVFGFVEHYRYGDPLSGAQMQAGSAWIMLKRLAPDALTPRQLGYGTQSLTIFVDDVEAHCKRAKSAGAVILEEAHETVYGEFQYAVRDHDGHHWLFSRHARDLSPAEWGATLVRPAAGTPVSGKP